AGMVTDQVRRTSFSGPALVRLLSRLARVEVAEPRQSTAARLDGWLGWTESIGLSKVLGAAASVSATAPATAGQAVDKSPGDAESSDIVNVIELANAQYTQVR